MINHISIGCSNLREARGFYDAILKPLEFVRVVSGEKFSGYGSSNSTDDQFSLKEKSEFSPPGPGFHIAFTAKTRKAVDEFYQAALSHGGRDNGPPGLRPHFGLNYYAAFIYDLDGHAIEAVCQMEEPLHQF